MVVRFIALALIAGAAWTAIAVGGEVYRWDLPAGFPTPAVPAANPMSEAKVQLGRRLFYDKRLSVNGSQSCASCHRQELAFTDGRAVSIGATGEAHPRSSMTLVNVVYNSALTWSNPGLQSLEKQALLPMFGEHPVELGMRGRERELLRSLQSEPVYRTLFAKAFTGYRRPFTLDNVTRALAVFERTIISARSPYDEYYRRGNAVAISEAAKRGEVLFFTDPSAGCFRCHGGFNFSDATLPGPPKFHNTALYQSYPAPNAGIFEFTHAAADAGKFKAPTLRNIGLTAPYMHDGSIATLREVIEHYAAGGRAHGSPNRDPRMTGFSLTAQNKEDLLAFLESLTDRELVRDARFSDPW